MINKLDAILRQKKSEVALLRKQLNENLMHPIHKILKGEITHASPKSFKHALCGSSLAVIAEIKRKAPSNGVLANIADPVILANTYVSGGANAISILTEEVFFNGQLADLVSVAHALRASSIPILRKDFIIDKIQVAESIVAGANAILCIVAAMGKQTKTIIDCAKRFGIEVLVEVIDQDELAIAIDAGAEIIGVNNRNLKTFEVDINTSLNLIQQIPASKVPVTESGISDIQMIVTLKRVGFKGFLIGENFMKQPDPAIAFADFVNQLKAYK